MKLITMILLLCVGLLIQISFISPKDSNFYDTKKAMWEKSREVTLAVANAMPEEKYGFRPVDEVRTFRDQMAHLSYSNSFILELFIEGKQVQFVDPDVSKMSKQEIIKMINDSFDQVINGMKNIDPDELDDMVTIAKDRKITKADVFIFMQDHVTNHRAKANLYIRLNNIKPPAYGF